MRIGIDAIAALGTSGNSTYSRQLIEHMLRLDAHNQWDLFSFLHDIGRPQFPRQKNRTEVHVQLSASYFPLPKLPEINDFLLRTIARLCRVDLFHFTNPLNYTAGSYKTVVTIHDLSALHDASWTRMHAGETFRHKLGALRSADTLIAVSQATKRDMVERLEIPPERVTVIYEGVSADFFPDHTESVEPLVGPNPYLICVGQLQPRKNCIALIDAFAAVAASFPALNLVFVGRPANQEYFQSLHFRITQKGIAERVVFLHGIDNATLRRLYTCAQCLVYPSLWEGFGLPVAESLRCGVPVITSNISSLPEVAGSAGLLVDPHSSDAIASAIEQFLSEPELRAELRAAIPSQVQKFNWDTAARETIQLYKQLRN